MENRYRTFVTKSTGWCLGRPEFFYEGPDREEAIRMFEAAGRRRGLGQRKSTPYRVICWEMEFREDINRWAWRLDEGALSLYREF